VINSFEQELSGSPFSREQTLRRERESTSGALKNLLKKPPLRIHAVQGILVVCRKSRVRSAIRNRRSFLAASLNPPAAVTASQSSLWRALAIVLSVFLMPASRPLP
jgi:hypothetical protein